MIDKNKIIFLNQKDISDHTTEEVHSLGLNNWKDWWCSAGLQSIYITHDGSIFRGTCTVGGYYGNIYEQMDADWVWNPLKSCIQCTRDLCACGSDMHAPKVKNEKDLSLIFDKEDLDKYNIVPQVTDPEKVFCGVWNEYKLVIWELGRRCNYDCWYCFPSSHNNYEAHKTLGSLLHGYEILKKFWAKNERMKFVFTGGEPTFNPQYLAFLEHLKSQDHIIHTTTNGTHNRDYYSKLMRLSDIQFSAHLSYLNEPKSFDKFLDNIRACADVKTTDNLNWLGVTIMLQPGRLPLAKHLYNECKKILDNVNVNLLHDLDKKIIEYSKEEIDWLVSLNK
jgi:MoaA/NifB/PqqE/SkfB family radical SAM enzyme